MRCSSIELVRVHLDGPRLMRLSREHLNSPVECLASCLLTHQLILSLSDGPRRSMALCIGSEPSLSEHKCLNLLLLSNMLVKSTTQEVGQSLLAKSLRQVLSHLPMKCGEAGGPNRY